MKICVCKNVSDNQINQYSTIDEFIKETRATTMCGTCTNSINKIFERKSRIRYASKEEVDKAINYVLTKYKDALSSPRMDDDYY